ncbi:VWA domain-containing protein [Rhizobium sp. MHM7A]|uniref:VWA domain-containing protein n=1 Tax=Rhizobium sp. MHM7A TaxID=2583233 RepID=UPI0011058BE2|nr:VWA domain-containing protein [Rhizobium sp. MHM7A]TLX16540.1 VWA domain-containing protein [Rhizobium sp. MHM7A]
MQINLQKSAQNLRISLEKRGIVKMPEMEMAALLDVSGSFDDEHRDGLTNDLLTRLIPWGMTFDPDKKADLFTFSSGERSAYLVGSVDEKNYINYIPNHVIDKVPGYNGGTHYSHVIRKALQHFGWIAGGEAPKSGGFFGKLFGGNKGASEASSGAPRRAILFFITDGEIQPEDKAATSTIVAQADNEGYEVFIIMIGASNQRVDFSFPDGLARNHRNVAFHTITDIKGFTRMSDDQINDFFLSDKLTAWLKK